MFTRTTERITWGETLAQEQHRRELLAVSGRQRSMRQESEQETAFYRLLLARLGERLVKWGCHLQARHGTLAEASRSIYHVKMLRQQLSMTDTGTGLSLCLGRK
jgi:hypothetical protein